MFSHRAIESPEAKILWDKLKRTISRDKAFHATTVIGELAAEDMLDFSGLTPNNIDRIYVKFRDGAPMASGIKKKLPNVDIQYIVSQLKQGANNPLTFWDEYDGYSNDIIWFADPVNATGGTAIKSLKFLRDHFLFDTALVSHVVANNVGIKNMQTTLEDFKTTSYMNYAYLSTKLNLKTGYLEDGLELIPDFGDKVLGTLGTDYSIYDIQDDILRLKDTQAGKVESLKGIILYLIQRGDSTDYRSDRSSAWITQNWLYNALIWYYKMRDLPIELIEWDKMQVILRDLLERDFLEIEDRPWKKGNAKVYHLTDDGVIYSSQVYIPVISTYGITGKILKDFDFLIKLRPDEIENNVRDENEDE